MSIPSLKTPTVMRQALYYFSVAMTIHHDQAWLIEKKEPIWAYGSEEWRVCHGGEACSMRGRQSRKLGTHIFKCKWRWSKAIIFQSPSPMRHIPLMRPHLLNLPNSSAANWRASVQIPEPVRDISHSNNHIPLLASIGSWPYHNTKRI